VVQPGLEIKMQLLELFLCPY